MKILGLDVASTTGWSIIDDGRLVKYGVIHIPAEMNIFQRLKYFEIELKKILVENEITYCSIEDVIMGISGAKTLAYLARLNGVAIICCYNHVNDNIKLYDPNEWKSKSFDSLHGHSTKVDIQLAVCRHFNLISEDDLKVLIQPIMIVHNTVETLQNEIKELASQTLKLKQLLARKRGGLKNQEEIDTTTNLYNITSESLENKKIQLKNMKKDIDNSNRQVSISIAAKCGITSDIGDSIGLALCAYKELT